MNWNELKDKHFKWACENGQHDTEHAYSHWAMLIITEISEAVQAERAGNVASREMFELNEEYNIMPFSFLQATRNRHHVAYRAENEVQPNPSTPERETLLTHSYQ